MSDQPMPFPDDERDIDSDALDLALRLSRILRRAPPPHHQPPPRSTSDRLAALVRFPVTASAMAVR